MKVNRIISNNTQRRRLIFSAIDSRLRHVQKIFRLMAVLLPLCLYWTAYTLFYGIGRVQPVMFFLSALEAVFAAFLLYGTLKTGFKLRTLKRERRIHE